MSEFTLRELTDLLRVCAGDPDEGVDLTDDGVLDVSFFDLGYDSLALLQITNVINRERGVELSDDAIAEAETPRMLLRLVNVGLPAEAH
ncbi:acyl carrier protein [Streptomyces sp. NBC_01618]|uniref:acyl carrier protein n=1 Tax=Streptomyces sp. NBC_01618 TaxID=2975900 RepID=UPI00386EE096|nr:acyl carrier protein [Streptomyces sp. NBC_01618]